MPTYSYACTECDNKFDAVQAFTDDALTTCPACQGKLRKLFNSVGVVFKGSGFYRTDSRESGKANGSSTHGSGTNGSEKASEKSSPSEKSSEKSSSSTDSSSSSKGSSSKGSSSSTSTTAAAST